MVNLENIELGKIANIHSDELKKWVEPRFNDVCSLYNKLFEHKGTKFPRSPILQKAAGKIPNKRKSNWIFLLKCNFNDKPLLADFKIIIDVLEKKGVELFLKGEVSEIHEVSVTMNTVFKKYQWKKRSN